jgi:hypothetical protein
MGASIPHNERLTRNRLEVGFFSSSLVATLTSVVIDEVAI